VKASKKEKVKREKLGLALFSFFLFTFALDLWWPGTDLNRRRRPFQGRALPTELPGRSEEDFAV
jgi:hypothetical protein